jgi:MFS family permease
MAASGVGALAGAVTVAGLTRFGRPAALQLWLGIALGLALIGFAVTPWFPLAVGLLVVVGFLFSAFSALNNTLLLANSEPRLTGRVMSIYLLTWALMPLGAVPLGWLTDQAGAPLALALAGAIVLTAVASLAVLHPTSHRIGWTH